MRLLFLAVFLVVNLLGSKTCNAQTGTFIWTNGAPTTNPGASGARFAVDRATFRWYEWVSGTTWIGSGDRIQQISGCSAPNYTPGIHNSLIVINSCTDPEIYIWNGSTWKMPPGGGGGGGTTYTAGTGINISVGNVISNTSPDQTVTITGATGVYPSFTLPDASATNELQTISTTGAAGNITLSNSGGTLNLNVNDADANPTNEIQALSTSGAAGNITLSNGGGTLNLNVNDADASATNEIQSLSLVGSNLSLSNGGGTVTLPTGGAASDSLYRIANVAAFANTSIASKWETGRVVSTDGFYSAGDGGAANYIIEASGTVDNVIIFAVGIRRARLIPNTDGGINFFQLGCIKNDAIADDARLQKGIDVFNSIYCFDNTAKFVFSKPLELKSNTKIELGRSTTIEKNNDWATLMLWNNGENNSRTPDSNIVILGGIWNKKSPPGQTVINGTFNPTPYTGALVDYGFCFTNCKNLRIENLSVLNCSKYTMSLNEQVKPYVHNIYLNSYSDGIDFIGKCEDIVIDGVTGKTYDDFVGIFATAWTTNIIGTMGNITNVSIKNIYPDYNTTSNTIVIGAGNSGGVPYTIRNVSIENVSSSRTNNPIIKVAQYGTVGDPVTETLTGGVVDGLNITNVMAGSGAAAVIEMGIDTIRNVNISNILFENSRPVSGVIINDGYLENINISNYTAQTNSYGLYIADSVNIRNISFLNCNISVGVTDKSAFLIENDSCSFFINNCNFRTKGTFDNAGLMLKGKDNRYSIANTRFFDTNEAINDFGARDTFLISNVVFNNKIGIYSGSTVSSTIIKAATYTHNSTDIPKKTFLRGSVNFPVIQTGNDENLFEITTSSAYSVPIEMPFGTTYRITNTNTSPIFINTNGSEVFASGSNNFAIPANATVTIKRFSSSLWRVIASGTGENFLPSGTSGQTLSYDASNRILANNQLENTSGALKANVRLTTQAGITANNVGENLIIQSNGTSNNGLLYGDGVGFALSNLGKTRELFNRSTGWNFTGNVGNGTPSPLAPFHIRSSTNSYFLAEFDGYGTTSSPAKSGIIMKAAVLDGAKIEMDARFNSGINHTDLRFFVTNSSGFLTNQFTMDGENGRLGVGVADPTSAVDVIGEIKSSSLAGTGDGILQASSSGVIQRTGILLSEISKTIKASATLDFPSTGPHTNSDLTATVTGAAVGDVVTVTPPLAAISAHSCYTAWVSAANTVTVRFNHYGTGGATNPASGVFNIIVTKF